MNQITLVIKFANDLNEGFYTCEASNAFGKSRRTVVVALGNNDDTGK